jgi:hypothetical protein
MSAMPPTPIIPMEPRQPTAPVTAPSLRLPEPLPVLRGAGVGVPRSWAREGALAPGSGAWERACGAGVREEGERASGLDAGARLVPDDLAEGAGPGVLRRSLAVWGVGAGVRDEPCERLEPDLTIAAAWVSGGSSESSSSIGETSSMPSSPASGSAALFGKDP